jgi:DNA repair protein RadC
MKKHQTPNPSSSIKHWSEDDRPREKLILKGKESLSDAELLAILLGSGYHRKSALDLAKELLANCGSDWNVLATSPFNELIQYKGIGPAKAINIIAALEIGARRESSVIPLKTKVRNSNMIYAHLKKRFQGLSYEVFYVVFLNFANEILDTIELSKGGMTSTVVDGKILFQHALKCQATGFILNHNHPSGNREPSHSDLKITKNIRDFAKLIDLQLIDHLIFTDNGYFSFADEGIL